MEYIIAILIIGGLIYLVLKNKSEIQVNADSLAPYKIESPVVVAAAPVVVETPIVAKVMPVVADLPTKKTRKPRTSRVEVTETPVKKAAPKKVAAIKVAPKAKSKK